ncbi:hypothetical protein, variant [Cladophialophora immunda]|uniref:MOSC domain-containing protein n=1 Tax=Cladophialophora immunda TaxID=569365 RepID=A0A0D2A4K5_9EURO|nr:uncharacterized protein PV07_01965 [Cladophialophora immunda]XP_016255477.1 hypothetical protein, variant [Cladophialophora immunda]KIW35260.1 hypothetical protein PV07_01965 [Cladophialophora immunda]KIW35261.1 hypothetical protein, variant [Cladophialophora immunda]
MHIQRLFIYPIKSLLPVEVTEAEITSTGLNYDRSFILIKETDDVAADEHTSSVQEHLTIKSLSKLCLFQPSILSTGETSSHGRLNVKHTLSGEEIEFPLVPTPSFLGNAEAYTVELFGTRAVGEDMGDEIAAWFTKHLGQKARLLYMVDGSTGTRDCPAPSLIPRKPKPRTGLLSWIKAQEEELHAQKIQFADAAPLLITTVSSERDAKGRVPKNVVEDEGEEDDVIVRFRSNVHIDNVSARGEHDSVSDDEGGESHSAPYAEENWKALNIVPASSGDDTAATNAPVHLDLVFNTVRCMSLNVDFRTGGTVPPERQLYRLLTKDRRVNPAFPYKPCFGRYAFAEPFGTVIRVGDRVEVEEWC